MILFYPVLQNDLSSIWCYQVLHFDPTILHHPGDLLRPDGFVCPGALALFACLALESKGLAALIMCLEIRICRCG
ncbi:MAG: hypothetical protein ACLR8P_16500 [Clostridium fessum]